jgi:hypothetical protein
MGELVRTLPCFHRFHAACIDPWLLLRRDACPVCQLSVVAATNTALARQLV